MRIIEKKGKDGTKQKPNHQSIEECLKRNRPNRKNTKKNPMEKRKKIIVKLTVLWFSSSVVFFSCFTTKFIVC